MKKIIFSFILFLSFFFIISVNALEENRLLFKLEDNEDEEEVMVYDSNLFEKEHFMKHIDMAPGRVYTDNLIIENGTEDTYSIFMKMVPKKEDDELLKEITIKVYCRDKLTYTGKAIGGEINEEFDNAMFICAIDSGDEADVRIESILDKNNNTPDSDLSYVDSVFFAQYGDFTPVEIVEDTVIEVNPETSRDKYLFPIKIIGIVVILLMIVIIFIQNKKEKNSKEEEEKIEILDE